MYKKILVPIDGSPTAQRGLDEAIALAGLTHAELELLHVVDAYPLLPDMAVLRDLHALREEMSRHGQRVLTEAAHEARDAGVTARVRLREIESGRAAKAIVETAREYRCDLIVMGTHGRRGLDRLLMGSDAEQVSRTSHLPVLLVPALQQAKTGA